MSETTNQQLLEEISQLERANRLRTEFVANVSHELRTPVNAMVGYAELLLEGVYGSLNTEQSSTMTHIRDIGHDLLALINNLLNVAKLESGRTDLVLSSFDLRGLISEVIVQLAPLADGKGLRLESRVLIADTTVRSDRGKLKQVLVNIVGNALKFADHGQVLISVAEAPAGALPAAPHHQRLLISVQDTGIGIPPDKLSRIFEAFYQADSSATRAYEGTGLGLFISKHLLALLEATIDVTSTVGSGTTISISLPVNFEEIAAIQRLRRHIEAAAHAAEPPTGGKRLVLVVSNHPDIAGVVADGLGTAEYTVRVTTAGHGTAALAEKLQPFVILLNAEAAASELWSVFQELKSQPATKDIPVIFLGGDTAQNFGAPLAVAAPLTHREILSSIRAAAGKKNVLIVDDNDAFREVLKCALQGEGYHISEAADGKQAIEQLTTHPPDLLLLDLHLPEIDGREVVQFITQRPELKDMEVLVISGDMPNDPEAVAITAKASGFMTKADFKVSAVLEKVANLLEAR